jgi:hypothetical protein
MNPAPVRLATSAKIFYCKDCDYQFTVPANTIFHDSLGISYKTAWYLCHRIRSAMASAEKVMLDGTL